LRSRIAIIPQEPILFVGTIRENIDLFNKNTDEEIWRALDSVHLGNFIRKLDQKLNSPVIENGKNFSVGQRQLFCIARAILSKTQILVLDEATAAVDLQTDKLIQDTIKLNFANLTVLTIAHRLNTIMESDKILVMDAGKVVEFAPPLALLERQDGSFHSLLKETGKESFNKLKRITEEKAARSNQGAFAVDPFLDPDNIIIDPKTNEDVVKKHFSTHGRAKGSLSSNHVSLGNVNFNLPHNSSSVGRINPNFVPEIQVVNETNARQQNKPADNEDDYQIYSF
jgi:ABC-type multidrug transport system ATPase subunit